MLPGNPHLLNRCSSNNSWLQNSLLGKRKEHSASDLLCRSSDNSKPISGGTQAGKIPATVRLWSPSWHRRERRQRASHRLAVKAHRAQLVLQSHHASVNMPGWRCRNCGSQNRAQHQYCWQCKQNWWNASPGNSGNPTVASGTIGGQPQQQRNHTGPEFSFTVTPYMVVPPESPLAAEHSVHWRALPEDEHGREEMRLDILKQVSHVEQQKVYNTKKTCQRRRLMGSSQWARPTLKRFYRSVSRLSMPARHVKK